MRGAFSWGLFKRTIFAFFCISSSALFSPVLFELFIVIRSQVKKSACLLFSIFWTTNQFSLVFYLQMVWVALKIYWFKFAFLIFYLMKVIKIIVCRFVEIHYPFLASYKKFVKTKFSWFFKILYLLNLIRCKIRSNIITFK